MTIPDFIDNYHLPPKILECTLEEVEEKFANINPIRQRKWAQCKGLLERLIDLGLKPEKILINGSFVTGREEPGDVDFAALILPDTVRAAITNATDEHDKAGIKLFTKRDNGINIRNLFGAHLLIADSEANLDGFANLFMKGMNGKLREPDPKRDPEWVIRPEVKGILKVKIS